MNDLIQAPRDGKGGLAICDANLIKTLQNSLYPGASEDSIVMVAEYCRHAKLDIMLKPVHIVRMDIKTGKKDKDKKDIYEKRDIIMPGINLYRIIAARSGCAGVSEPEFGPNIIETLDGTDICYPEWCKITVKRIVGGKIVEFTAKEYWKENYAVSGAKYNSQTGKLEKSRSPNAMWQKRPFGQLAKCTEAQAYRKGFPEVGSAPTAEEMEGKQLDSEAAIEVGKSKIVIDKGMQELKKRLAIQDDTQEELREDEVIQGEIIDSTNLETITSEKMPADTIIFLLENSSSKKELMEAMRHLKDLNIEDKNKVYAVYKKIEATIKS